MDRAHDRLHAAERLLFIGMVMASTVLALVSFRYFLGIGPYPPKILANTFARPWLTIHVGASALALLLGSFQFLPRLRMRMAKAHIWFGRCYVVACCAGSVTGFVLAFGTTLGPVASAGFSTLSVLWLLTAGLGWSAARKRDIKLHRIWMIRSWALTFAAVNLRAYLGVADLLGIAFDDSYPVISFLAWLPNLAMAEFCLRRRPAPLRGMGRRPLGAERTRPLMGPANALAGDALE